MEMHDFKMGDEVWWFEFPEQGAGLMSEVVLKNSIICETMDDKYLGVEACHALHRFDIDLYHSKVQAIDAMLEQLRKISEERSDKK